MCVMGLNVNVNLFLCDSHWTIMSYCKFYLSKTIIEQHRWHLIIQSDGTCCILLSVYLCTYSMLLRLYWCLSNRRFFKTKLNFVPWIQYFTVLWVMFSFRMRPQVLLFLHLFNVDQKKTNSSIRIVVFNILYSISSIKSIWGPNCWLTLLYKAQHG